MKSSSIESEFETVSLLLSSGAETRAVDAFALALIKAERQIRRIFTHLVYQYPSFGPGDVSDLRRALANSRRVYFEGFIAGFNQIYPRSVEALIGSDYQCLHDHVAEAIEHRNKIFHGQLTTKQLSRKDLEEIISHIQSWCARLASGALAELAYDGFVRNSFQKSSIAGLSFRYGVQLGSVADYEDFIRSHMER